AMVVAAEPDALAAVLVAPELDRGLVPLPDGGDLFDDGAVAPRHRERTRDFARLTLHVPHADTRLQGLRGAIRPARAPRLRDPRGRARLRQRRGQRSLPPLARHGRPRSLLVRLAGGGRRPHEAHTDWNERRHAVIPLSPGDRGPGHGDRGAPGAGP